MTFSFMTKKWHSLIFCLPNDIKNIIFIILVSIMWKNSGNYQRAKHRKVSFTGVDPRGLRDKVLHLVLEKA